MYGNPTAAVHPCLRCVVSGKYFCLAAPLHSCHLWYPLTLQLHAYWKLVFDVLTCYLSLPCTAMGLLAQLCPFFLSNQASSGCVNILLCMTTDQATKFEKYLCSCTYALVKKNISPVKFPFRLTGLGIMWLSQLANVLSSCSYCFL